MQTEQKPSCTACRYTDGQSGGSLTCQRYPQPHRVARSYWCGEFKPLVEAQPVEAKPAEVKTSRPRARLTISEGPTVTRTTDGSA
jgi:hypothetical protein